MEPAGRWLDVMQRERSVGIAADSATQATADGRGISLQILEATAGRCKPALVPSSLERGKPQQDETSQPIAPRPGQPPGRDSEDVLDRRRRKPREHTAHFRVAGKGPGDESVLNSHVAVCKAKLL